MVRPPAAHHFLVAAIATFVQRSSMPSARILRIGFAHTRPAHAVTYRAGTDVVFGVPSDVIVLRSADLSAPTPWPNAEVARAFEREAEKCCERLAANDDVVGQIPRLVARLFDTGSVSMERAW